MRKKGYNVRMKKILILGANPETAVLVKMAQKMGIYAIVTDNIPGSYAKKIADKSWDIDGMDVKGIVNEARHEQVDGVMVGTADPLIMPYYKICSQLGLPCYGNEKSVTVLTNKAKFKAECSKFGIAGVPEYTLEQCKNGTVFFPVLVKPSDGRSGKGMTLCYSKDELPDAIEKAKEFSNCKKFLIEHYMQCDDVFMYYTFVNGKCFLSAMADRYTSKDQVGADPVVLGGIYPSKYLMLYMETLHEKMCEMFSDLGIDNGILLIQAFVEDGKFYVYDPGFRLQGGAPHLLVDAINHFDHRRMLINFALTGDMGEKDIAERNDVLFRGKIGASQTVLLKCGKIARIEGIKEISNDVRVVATTQRLFEGDEVYLRGTEQQILVRFHMVCKDKNELRELVKKINKTVHAFDNENNDMCLQGLRAECV